MTKKKGKKCNPGQVIIKRRSIKRVLFIAILTVQNIYQGPAGGWYPPLQADPVVEAIYKDENVGGILVRD
jgi:hypothetical protein